MSEEERKNNEAIDALQMMSGKTEEREYDTFWLDVGQVIVPVLFLVCCLAVLYFRGMFDDKPNVDGSKPAPIQQGMSNQATVGPKSSSDKFFSVKDLYDMRQRHGGYQVTVRKPNREQITVKRQFVNDKLARVKVLRGGSDSMWFIINTNDESVVHKCRGDIDANKKDLKKLARELEVNEDVAKRVWYGLWQCGEILPVHSMEFLDEVKIGGRNCYLIKAGELKVWLDNSTKLPVRELLGAKVWSYEYTKAEFTDADFNPSDDVVP